MPKANKLLEKSNIFFILIILIIVTFSLRIQTFNLPETDNMAREYVYKNLALQNKQETEIIIERLSQKYKEFYRDDTGQTYLYNYDPYYYYRQARNIIEKGGVGEITKDGKQYDTFRVAPDGAFIKPSLLPYVEAYTYKIMHFFNKNISLMKAVFYVPVIFGVLSVILIFFIARKISNNLGGFIAAFLLAIHPQSFVVTFAGFTDTGALNLFFSLLIVWLFVEGIDFKNKIKSGIFLTLMIPAILIFKFAWYGYYYILYILAAYVLIFLFIKHIKPAICRKFPNKDSAIIFAVLIATAFLLLNFIKSGRGVYLAKLLRIKGGEALLSGSIATVGELQRLQLGLYIHFLGGWILFLIALISTIFLIRKIKFGYNNNIKENKYNILILVWFFSLFLIPLFARRFMQYFVPVFCIVIGLGIATFLPKFIKIVESFNFKNKRIILFFYGILIILLLIVPMKSRLDDALTILPAVDDSFYNTAEKIRLETPSNTIIIAWWDYGYFFQAIAERGTVFDGGSFGTEQMHWVSKALLTHNENESVEILRTLSCGSVSVCNTPIMLVLSHDMLIKMPAIKPFAEWDTNTTKLNITGAKDYITSIFRCVEREKIICGNDIEFYNMTAFIRNKKPNKVFLINGTDVQTNSFKDGEEFDLIMLENKQGFRAFAVDPWLSDTVLFRLLVLNGYGLENFELFSDVSGDLTTRVIAWRLK